MKVQGPGVSVHARRFEGVTHVLTRMFDAFAKADMCVNLFGEWLRGRLFFGPWFNRPLIKIQKSEKSTALRSIVFVNVALMAAPLAIAQEAQPIPSPLPSPPLMFVVRYVDYPVALNLDDVDVIDTARRSEQ